MSPKDAIRNTIDMSQMVAGAYTSDLADGDLLVRPVPGMNHIAWQIGHLIASERQMMEILQPVRSLPEGFVEAHSKETAASDDASKFHTLAEYQALWTAQREATKKILDSYSDLISTRAARICPATLPPWAPCST